MSKGLNAALQFTPERGRFSPQNNWVQRTGRIVFPRTVAYFWNKLWQPIVETACRHICDGRVQSLYSFFKVFHGKKKKKKKKTVSKVQDIANRLCFHSSRTLHDHLILEAVDFGTELSTLLFSSFTHFGCRLCCGILNDNSLMLATPATFTSQNNWAERTIFSYSGGD